jgi:16S rRNA (guanine527-N7)-methyltransferase
LTADPRLAAYVELVRSYAPRLDLVSPHDLDRFYERHVADSLRLAPLLDELSPGPAVDVGSGAGLPGIPLAVVSPGREWRLLEPRRRRAAFLEEVVRELELGCEVLTVAAEEAARDPRLASAHALATARALAPPERTLELLLPLVAPGGAGAIFLGSGRPPPQSRLWREGLAIVRP